MKKVNATTIYLMLLLCIVAGDEIETNADENGAITMKLDKPLELQCNVTSMPEATIIWKHDGKAVVEDDYIKIKNHWLRIDKPNEERDTGSYDCVVELQAKHLNASIFVQTELRVEPFHKSLNLVQGDKLVLTCKVKGFPPPDLITWYKDGVGLMNDSGEPNTRVKFESNNNVKNAKLIIEELEYEDKAMYTCQAESRVNAVNTTIQVRVKDKLAALWPFLGICAEVAILCTIIFVYEKKRVKPDFDESDADHSADNKNVHDQKEGGQDVRQRK